MASLDQLHSTLAHEAALRHQLQMEVFDAQAALAQARAELAGTQAQESRARHLALHDELTQLPNRSFFRERMEHALAQREQQGQSLALLTLDLDGFKLINDAHGHDTGDAVLRIVAARLARAVRATDMVSRLGGDEFACLMANLHSRDQLSRLACKLFDAVSAPLKTGKLTFNVCPSIGIAIGPSDGVTAEALLESADGAMVRAKRQQTVYAFFDRRVDA